jgi:hypothetical protein
MLLIVIVALGLSLILEKRRTFRRLAELQSELKLEKGRRTVIKVFKGDIQLVTPARIRSPKDKQMR